MTNDTNRQRELRKSLERYGTEGAGQGRQNKVLVLTWSQPKCSVDCNRNRNRSRNRNCNRNCNWNCNLLDCVRNRDVDFDWVIGHKWPVGEISRENRPCLIDLESHAENDCIGREKGWDVKNGFASIWKG